MIRFVVLSLLKQQVDSAELLRDLAQLGVKSAREIHFQLGSGVYLGNKISQDGTIIFQTRVLRPSLISLRDGKLMWEERMRIGKTSKFEGWIVATMSQWGHMPYGPELRDASLEDIETKNHWLGLGSIKEGKKLQVHKVIVADIDTNSRKLPPNRQVIFSRPDAFSNSAFSGFSGHFMPNGGIQYHVFAKTPSSETLLDIWTFAKGAKVASGKSTKLAIPWTESNYATDYDPVRRRVIIHFENPRHHYEYDIKSKVTVEIPNIPNDIGPHYWRGKMLQASGVGSTAPAYGLDLFSDDRKTFKHLGPYSWIAHRSNERFVLFKKETDAKYWLVDFGSASHG